MKPKIHIVTREQPTPLITACLVHLIHRAEITNDSDVLLSIQGDKIIPMDELSRYRLALNIHNAKLPEYGGFNCLEWEIHNRERWHISTMHHMTEQVDGGPIAYEYKIPIWDMEKPQSVYYRSITSCINLIDRLLADLEAGCEVPRMEQVGERRFYKRSECP